MPLPLPVDGQLDGLTHDNRWSNETIDTYADEIADALEAVTQAVLAEALRRLRFRSHDQETTEDPGVTLTASAAFEGDPADLFDLDLWRTLTLGSLEDTIGDTLVNSAWSSALAGGRLLDNVDGDIIRRAIDEHVSDIQAWGEQMKGTLGKQLWRVIADGGSVADLERALERRTSLNPNLVRNIARTQAIAALNAGALAAWSPQSELRPDGTPPDPAAGKEWITLHDGRARQSHLWADGQVVAIDAEFVVGGRFARYPGDPRLPPDERINCRCSLYRFDIAQTRRAAAPDVSLLNINSLRRLAASMGVKATGTKRQLIDKVLDEATGLDSNRLGDMSYAQLYSMARRYQIPGRSRMNKAELRREVQAEQDRINGVSPAPLTPPEVAASAAAPDDISEWLDRTLSERARVEPLTTPLLQKVAAEHGGHLEGLDYRFKKPDGLVDKVARRVRDLGVPVETATQAVNDALRYTFVFEPAQYASGTRDALDTLRAEGWLVDDAQVLNNWVPGDAYNGINAIVRHPDGLPVEVQFHTPESFDVKQNRNHELYEKLRSGQGTPFERLDWFERMRDTADQITFPPDVTTIGTMQARPFTDDVPLPKAPRVRSRPRIDPAVLTEAALDDSDDGPYAPIVVQADAIRLASDKARAAPKPTPEQVARNRAEIRRAATEGGRPGGDLRGSSTARARLRENLWREFGGETLGYSPCVHCGIKLHYSTDPELNPNGYGLISPDKLLVGWEGGRYSVPNTVPACLGCNQSRGDRDHGFGRPVWEGDIFDPAAYEQLTAQQAAAYQASWDAWRATSGQAETVDEFVREGRCSPIGQFATGRGPSCEMVDRAAHEAPPIPEPIVAHATMSLPADLVDLARTGDLDGITIQTPGPTAASMTAPPADAGYDPTSDPFGEDPATRGGTGPLNGGYSVGQRVLVGSSPAIVSRVLGNGNAPHLIRVQAFDITTTALRVVDGEPADSEVVLGRIVPAPEPFIESSGFGMFQPTLAAIDEGFDANLHSQDIENLRRIVNDPALVLARGSTRARQWEAIDDNRLLELAKLRSFEMAGNLLGFTAEQIHEAKNAVEGHLTHWGYSGGASAKRSAIQDATRKLRDGGIAETPLERGMLMQKWWTKSTLALRDDFNPAAVPVTRFVSGGAADAVKLARMRQQDTGERAVVDQWPLTSWATPAAADDIKTDYISNLGNVPYARLDTTTTADSIWFAWHAEPYLRSGDLRAPGEYVVDDRDGPLDLSRVEVLPGGRGGIDKATAEKIVASGVDIDAALAALAYADTLPVEPSYSGDLTSKAVLEAAGFPYPTETVEIADAPSEMSLAEARAWAIERKLRWAAALDAAAEGGFDSAAFYEAIDVATEIVNGKLAVLQTLRDGEASMTLYEPDEPGTFATAFDDTMRDLGGQLQRLATVAATNGKPLVVADVLRLIRDVPINEDVLGNVDTVVDHPGQEAFDQAVIDWLTENTTIGVVAEARPTAPDRAAALADILFNFGAADTTGTPGPGRAQLARNRGEGTTDITVDEDGVAAIDLGWSEPDLLERLLDSAADQGLTTVRIGPVENLTTEAIGVAHQAFRFVPADLGEFEAAIENWRGHVNAQVAYGPIPAELVAEVRRQLVEHGSIDGRLLAALPQVAASSAFNQSRHSVLYQAGTVIEVDVAQWANRDRDLIYEPAVDATVHRLRAGNPDVRSGQYRVSAGDSARTYTDRDEAMRAAADLVRVGAPTVLVETSYDSWTVTESPYTVRPAIPDPPAGFHHTPATGDHLANHPLGYTLVDGDQSWQYTSLDKMLTDARYLSMAPGRTSPVVVVDGGRREAFEITADRNTAEAPVVQVVSETTEWEQGDDISGRIHEPGRMNRATAEAIFDPVRREVTRRREAEGNYGDGNYVAVAHPDGTIDVVNRAGPSNITRAIANAEQSSKEAQAAAHVIVYRDGYVKRVIQVETATRVAPGRDLDYSRQIVRPGRAALSAEWRPGTQAQLWSPTSPRPSLDQTDPQRVNRPVRSDLPRGAFIAGQVATLPEYSPDLDDWDGDRSGWDQVSPEVRDSWNAALRHMKAVYPWLDTVISEVKVGEIDSIGLASFREGVITMQRAYYEDADAARRNTARMVRQGWWSGGIGADGRGDLAAVLIHEVGHLIHGIAATDPDTGDFDWGRMTAITNGVDRIVRAHEPQDSSTPDQRFYRGDYRTATGGASTAGRGISVYSSTNAYEIVAESFLDVWYHGDQAAEKSKDVIAYIEGVIVESNPDFATDGFGMIQHQFAPRVEDRAAPEPAAGPDGTVDGTGNPRAPPGAVDDTKPLLDQLLGRPSADSRALAKPAVAAVVPGAMVAWARATVVDGTQTVEIRGLVPGVDGGPNQQFEIQFSRTETTAWAVSKIATDPVTGNPTAIVNNQALLRQLMKPPMKPPPEPDRAFYDYATEDPDQPRTLQGQGNTERFVQQLGLSERYKVEARFLNDLVAISFRDGEDGQLQTIRIRRDLAANGPWSVVRSRNVDADVHRALEPWLIARGVDLGTLGPAPAPPASVPIDVPLPGHQEPLLSYIARVPDHAATLFGWALDADPRFRDNALRITGVEWDTADLPRIGGQPRSVTLNGVSANGGTFAITWDRHPGTGVWRQYGDIVASDDFSGRIAWIPGNVEIMWAPQPDRWADRRPFAADRPAVPAPNDGERLVGYLERLEDPQHRLALVQAQLDQFAIEGRPVVTDVEVAPDVVEGIFGPEDSGTLQVIVSGLDGEGRPWKITLDHGGDNGETRRFLGTGNEPGGTAFADFLQVANAPRPDEWGAVAEGDSPTPEPDPDTPFVPPVLPRPKPGQKAIDYLFDLDADPAVAAAMVAKFTPFGVSPTTVRFATLGNGVRTAQIVGLSKDDARWELHYSRQPDGTTVLADRQSAPDFDPRVLDVELTYRPPPAPDDWDHGREVEPEPELLGLDVGTSVEDVWAAVTSRGNFPEDSRVAFPDRYIPAEGPQRPLLRQGQIETRLAKADNGVPMVYDATPLPPGEAISDYEMVDMGGGEDPDRPGRSRPLVKVAGSERPLSHVYRVISEEEWQAAVAAGELRSDGRMNLSSDEGTVTSVRHSGLFYFPPEGMNARIVAIRVDPADNPRIDPNDGYVKFPEGIPLARIEAVTPQLVGRGVGHESQIGQVAREDGTPEPIRMRATVAGGLTLSDEADRIRVAEKLLPGTTIARVEVRNERVSGTPVWIEGSLADGQSFVLMLTRSPQGDWTLDSGPDPDQFDRDIDAVVAYLNEPIDTTQRPPEPAAPPVVGALLLDDDPDERKRAAADIIPGYEIIAVERADNYGMTMVTIVTERGNVRITRLGDGTWIADPDNLDRDAEALTAYLNQLQSDPTGPPGPTQIERLGLALLMDGEMDRVMQADRMLPGLDVTEVIISARAGGTRVDIIATRPDGAVVEIAVIQRKTGEWEGVLEDNFDRPLDAFVRYLNQDASSSLLLDPPPPIPVLPEPVDDDERAGDALIRAAGPDELKILVELMLPGLTIDEVAVRDREGGQRLRISARTPEGYNVEMAVDRDADGMWVPAYADGLDRSYADFVAYLNKPAAERRDVVQPDEPVEPGPRWDVDPPDGATNGDGLLRDQTAMETAKFLLPGFPARSVVLQHRGARGETDAIIFGTIDGRDASITLTKTEHGHWRLGGMSNIDMDPTRLVELANLPQGETEPPPPPPLDPIPWIEKGWSAERAARIAAAVSGKPSLDQVIDPTNRNLESQNRIISKVFEVDLSAIRVTVNGRRQGVRVRTNTTTRDMRGYPDAWGFVWRGVIETDSGDHLGTITRQVYKKNDSEPVAYHAYFELDEEARGAGIAGAINGALEDWYIANGLASVGIEAALTRGPYVWPRQGYDFDTSFTPYEALDYFRDWAGALETAIHNDYELQSDQEMLELAEAFQLLARPAEDRNRSAAELVAAFGYAYDSPRGRAMLDYADLIEQLETAIDTGDDDVVLAEDDTLPSLYDLTQIGWRPGDTDWLGAQAYRWMAEADVTPAIHVEKVLQPDWRPSTRFPKWRLDPDAHTPAPPVMPRFPPTPAEIGGSARKDADGALADDQFTGRRAYLEGLADHLVLRPGGPFDTSVLHTYGSADEATSDYFPERVLLHERLISQVISRARHTNVPSDRKAILLGGIPVGGKMSTVQLGLLGQLGVKTDDVAPTNYLVISTQEFQKLLVGYGAPIVPGLTPGESAYLVKAEAQRLAALALERAKGLGLNIIVDVPFGMPGHVQMAVDLREEDGYTVDGAFVDVTIDQAKALNADEHRRGVDRWLVDGAGQGPIVQTDAYIDQFAADDGTSAPRAIFQDAIDGGAFDRAIVIDNGGPTATIEATYGLDDTDAEPARTGFADLNDLVTADRKAIISAEIGLDVPYLQMDSKKKDQLWIRVTGADGEATALTIDGRSGTWTVTAARGKDPAVRQRLRDWAATRGVDTGVLGEGPETAASFAPPVAATPTNIGPATKGAGGQLTPAQAAARRAHIAQITLDPFSDYRAGGPLDTAVLHTDPATGAWTQDRAEFHEALVDQAINAALDAGVPLNRSALVLAGPGAGKATAVRDGHLAVFGVGPDTHLVVDVDAIQDQIIAAGQAPTIPGLAPAEAAHLVREEAIHVAQTLTARAADLGLNIRVDTQLDTPALARQHAALLREYGYEHVAAAHVPADPASAASAAASRHQAGIDRWLAGNGPGGRPPEYQITTGAPAVFAELAADGTFDRTVTFDADLTAIGATGGIDPALITGIDRDPADPAVIGSSEPGTPPLTDDQHAARLAYIDTLDVAETAAAVDDLGSYPATRAALHERLVAEAMAAAAPRYDRRAVLIAGPDDAWKAAAVRSGHLAALGVDGSTSGYVTIDPAAIADQLIAAGVAPRLEGLTPAESTALVHEEAAHVAALLAERATSDGANIIWITPIADVSSGRRKIESLTGSSYEVTGAYVDTDDVDVVARHRSGVERYKAGVGQGGTPPPRAAADRAAFEQLATEGALATAYVVGTDGAADFAVGISPGDITPGPRTLIQGYLDAVRDGTFDTPALDQLVAAARHDPALRDRLLDSLPALQAAAAACRA